MNLVRLVLLISAVLLSILLSACKGEGQAKQPAGRPPVPVVVSSVSQRTIPIEVRAIGNVEPFSTISVKSQVGGELQSVFFTEGDMVKKGQKLFQIDPRPAEETIRQLEANLARDTAQAKNAETDAERYKELAKEGVIARQQYETVAANAAALKATLAADEAAISNAKLQLLYTTIYSPIDGKTGNLMVKEGNLVKANDVALVTINQIEPIYVTFSVPEIELPAIRRRMSSNLVVRAYAPGESEPATGTLTFIDNAVDQTTGTIRLKGTFPNKEHRLWPGQFVNVVLTVGQQPNAVLVPSQAVQAGQQGQYVYVIDASKKAQMRTVSVGRSVGEETAVIGVQPGESVVIDGQSRLTPGTAVQVVTKSPEAAAVRDYGGAGE
jgi:multidrug efflux system membrane fusion protein